MMFVQGDGTRGADNAAEGAAESAEQEALRGEGVRRPPRQGRLRGAAAADRGWRRAPEHHPTGKKSLSDDDP